MKRIIVVSPAPLSTRTPPPSRLALLLDAATTLAISAAEALLRVAVAGIVLALVWRCLP